MILEGEAGTLVFVASALDLDDLPTLRRAEMLAERWPGLLSILALRGRDDAVRAAFSGRARVVFAEPAGADPARLLREASPGAIPERIYARLRGEDLPRLLEFSELVPGAAVDLELGSDAGVPEIAPLWVAADSLVVAEIDRRYPLSAGSPALPVRVVPDGDDAAVRGALAELPLFGGELRLSVVVPVYRHAAQAVRLVGSLLAWTSGLLEVILVDDASPDGSLALLERLAMRDTRIRLLVQRSRCGFAACVNRGLAAVRGDLAAILHADAVATPDWAERLVAHLVRPSCGAVGPSTNRAGTPQRLPGVAYDERSLAGLEEFAAAFAAERRGQATPIVRLGAPGLLVPRRALRRVGGLDPRFFPGHFALDDWSARLLVSGDAPYRADDAFLHHDGEGTPANRGEAATAERRASWSRFREKWGLAGDRSESAGWTASDVDAPYDRSRHFIAPWEALEPVERQ